MSMKNVTSMAYDYRMNIEFENGFDVVDVSGVAGPMQAIEEAIRLTKRKFRRTSVYRVVVGVSVIECLRSYPNVKQ